MDEPTEKKYTIITERDLTQKTTLVKDVFGDVSGNTPAPSGVLQNSTDAVVENKPDVNRNFTDLLRVIDQAYFYVNGSVCETERHGTNVPKHELVSSIVSNFKRILGTGYLHTPN